jgi:subfamily B ATP-binding cassette protein MsbA
VTLKPLAKLNNDIQESAAAGGRIREILNLPVEPTVRGGFKRETLPALPRHRDSITLDGVTYTYPGADTPTLHDVDLDIKHGQHVAIVGPNGSGKTTLIGLIPRLHEPDSGVVRIDGQDICSVTLRSLRRQIALVTQHAVLFEGTVADNIAYGLRHARRGEVEAAAARAHAAEFIAHLPHGYDTRLGEQGLGLSGGQKQRICLARAMLRDPAILLLDEATSQVDAESEAKIQAALAEFRRGRTTLTIAHRLSTVIDADVIVVMQDGRIIDRGSHRELLERCGLYQTLTKTQLQTAEA